MNRRNAISLAGLGAAGLAVAGWDSLGQRRRKKMSELYLPTSASFLFSTWTATGAPSAYEAVDDDPRFGQPNLTDYIGGIATETNSTLLGFTFPPRYTATLDYGDGTIGTQFGIAQLQTRLVLALSAAGPADLSLRFITDTGESANTVPITAVAPSVQTVTVTTSQKDGGALWTAGDLPLPAVFALAFAGFPTNPAVNIRIYAVALYVTISDAAGSTKARLGPSAGEPAYFCAICSTPHHLGKLIKPRDPLHPQYERLVCSDCYDDITQYQTPEQRIKEGDFDFES